MLVSLLGFWELMPFWATDDRGGGGGGAGGDDLDREHQDDDDITDEDDDVEDDEDREDSDDDDDDDEPLGEAGTRALRRERRRRREAEANLRKLQRKAGSDDDEDDESEDAADLETQLERTLRELHEARAESALVKAATEAGAVSVRAVVALARDELTFDKDGRPRNLRSVMKALQEDDPELFRAADGSADGGEGGGDATVRDHNAALRRQIRRQRRGT